MTDDFHQFANKVRACTLCAERFAGTATAHQPRPIVWFAPAARILIAGQAPGARVHQSGKPFTDPSGDRLRDWMGIDEATFYNLSQLAIVPMAFCFPGYNDKGSDLSPPKICADEWRDDVLRHLNKVRLTILVGGYAQKWHLEKAAAEGVTRTVQGWRDHAPAVFALPHPSWRNTGWVRKNPWFEAELIPALRVAVKEVLHD